MGKLKGVKLRILDQLKSGLDHEPHTGCLLKDLRKRLEEDHDGYIQSVQSVDKKTTIRQPYTVHTHRTVDTRFVLPSLVVTS
jgi:hypothetical protein